MKRLCSSLLLLTLAAWPCLAANDLGRSGPFRLIGGDRCGADFLAQRNGACDPPQVETSGLSAAAATAARIERARRLLGFVRVEAALHELDTAILAEPGAVDALHLRARLLLSQFNFAAARRDLDQALKADPSNAAVHSTSAYLHLQVRQMPEALRHIEFAMTTAPDDPDARWVRALILIAAGQWETAELDLDVALRDEGNWRARLSRAEIYLRQERFEAAASEADLLLEARPQNFESLHARVLANVGARRLDRALADLSSMIGPPGGPYLLPPKHPSFGRLTFQRAMILASAGQRDEALKDVEYVLAAGGLRAILRLQIFLRHNGLPDVVLDGKRSAQLDEAILACFGQAACGRGLAQKL